MGCPIGLLSLTLLYRGSADRLSPQVGHSEEGRTFLLGHELLESSCVWLTGGAWKWGEGREQVRAGGEGEGGQALQGVRHRTAQDGTRGKGWGGSEQNASPHITCARQGAGATGRCTQACRALGKGKVR